MKSSTKFSLASLVLFGLGAFAEYLSCNSKNKELEEDFVRNNRIVEGECKEIGKEDETAN